MRLCSTLRGLVSSALIGGLVQAGAVEARGSGSPEASFQSLSREIRSVLPAESFREAGQPDALGAYLQDTARKIRACRNERCRQSVRQTASAVFRFALGYPSSVMLAGMRSGFYRVKTPGVSGYMSFLPLPGDEAWSVVTIEESRSARWQCDLVGRVLASTHGATRVTVRFRSGSMKVAIRGSKLTTRAKPLGDCTVGTLNLDWAAAR